MFMYLYLHLHQHKIFLTIQFSHKSVVLDSESKFSWYLLVGGSEPEQPSKRELASLHNLNLLFKLNNDLQDLTMTKGNSMWDKTHKENISSTMKKESKESSVSPEVVVKVEETKMKKSTQEKRKWLTFDLEKEDQDRTTQYDGHVGSSYLERDQKQQKQAEPTIPKKKKSDPPPSSSALTNNRPHWASRLPPLGPTAMSIDGKTGTSKALQDPHCPLSHPREKRCTTHHHIAWNIYLHQQFVETNKFRLAPASMFDKTLCNLSLMLPSNPSQGGFVSANVNSTQGQGNDPGCSEKDKSFGVATNSNDDNVHRKQLAFQQTLQPASVGNLQLGPPLFIHTGQNQAAAATQPGVLKSINNPPLSSITSASRASPASTPLSAGAATMSFSYPVIAANEAPCLAMLPYNGYPAPAQAMPYFNGPFYSPQMFHPSQLHQQQPPHSQASSGSSSPSHKKLQPWGLQNKANNIKQTLNAQSSKGGVELDPQAFTVSFASPNGNPVAPNISFSSKAQNPALFHNLPHSNQVVAAGQIAQQRHYQEGKESKAAASGQTHLFDNSARTLNFMAPPVIGNWSSRSTAVASGSSPVSANSSNSKQQHQLQLQRQHVPAPMSSNHAASSSTKLQSNSPNPQPLHLQKQQSAPASSNLAVSAPTSAMLFSQAPNQSYTFGQSQSQSPQWKTNSARNYASNMASSGQNKNSTRNSSSNMASSGQNSNSARNSSDNRASSAQNPNPAGNYASNMVSLGQKPSSARNYASSMVMSGQNQISFACATITCPPMEENSNLRTVSMGSTNAGSSAPSLQQIDNSTTTRTTQKSSPVCGRNVPSILMSPPPNHLPELKH